MKCNVPGDHLLLLILNHFNKIDMAKISAYLTFAGNCADAMAYYNTVFNGEIKIQTVKGSPMETHFPQDVQENVLHASVSTAQLEILGSDMVRSDGLTHGNSLILALICDNDEEQEALFSRLAEGGTINYPLHSFYEGRIGGVTDKFGVTWLVKK